MEGAVRSGIAAARHALAGSYLSTH
jgi:hypothetical protein